MAAIHHQTLKKAKSFGIVLTVEDNDVVATKDGVQLASGLQGNKVLEAAIAKLTPEVKGAVTGRTTSTTSPVTEIAKDGVKVKPTKVSKVVELSPAELAAKEAAEAEGWKALRAGGFVRKTPGEETDYSEAKTWAELCEEQDIEVEQEEAEEEEAPASVIKDKYKKIYAQTAVKGTCGDDLAKQLREYLMVDTEDGPRIDKKKLRKWAEANGVWVAAYGSMKVGMIAMNTRNRLRGNMRKAEKAGEVFEVQWP